MTGIPRIGHAQLRLPTGNGVQVQDDVDLVLLAPAKQSIQQLPPAVSVEKTIIQRHTHDIEPCLGDLLDVGFGDEVVVDLGTELLGLPEHRPPFPAG